MKVVENESQATHWRHVKSFLKSNLEYLKLYPVRCEILNEITHYYINDGKDKINTDWLKQNCLGDFVVVEKQKKKSCGECNIKDTCCDREMIEGV